MEDDKSKGGRPSKFTEELVETICDRLAKGEPLAAICRDEGFPHPSTVRDWMADRPEVSRAIARAREDGEDWLAAECLSIADDGQFDYTVVEDDGEVTTRLNSENIQRSKLRIETRLKLLAKFNPKRWGDKQSVEVTGDPDKPLHTITRIELVDLE